MTPQKSPWCLCDGNKKIHLIKRNEKLSLKDLMLKWMGVQLRGDGDTDCSSPSNTQTIVYILNRSFSLSVCARIFPTQTRQNKTWKRQNDPYFLTKAVPRCYNSDWHWHQLTFRENWATQSPQKYQIKHRFFNVLFPRERVVLTAGEDERTRVLVHREVVQLQLAFCVYRQPEKKPTEFVRRPSTFIRTIIIMKPNHVNICIYSHCQVLR